jgi:hypothetical protein
LLYLERSVPFQSIWDTNGVKNKVDKKDESSKRNDRVSDSFSIS